MIEPTESERRELNERLARARGWTLLVDGYWQSWQDANGAVKNIRPSCGEFPAGDFTRDPAASRELVLWLKSQPVGIARHFIAEICHQLWPQDEIFVSSMRIDDLRFFDLLLASPLLIAIAADAATGGKDEC